MRNRKYLIGTLAAVVSLLAIPALAHGAGTVTSLSFKSATTKSKVPKKKRAGVSERVDVDTTHDAYGPPLLQMFDRNPQFDFDNDYAFSAGNGTKVPPCSQSKLAGTTTPNAIAACPTSVIGSGNVTANGVAGPASGAVTAFMGPPNGKLPGLLVHVRLSGPMVPGGSLTLVLIGTIVPSPLGGDYGSRVNVAINPAEAGGGAELITHLDLTVNRTVVKPKNKKKGKPAKYLLSARCKDKNKTWETQFTGNYVQQATLAPTGSLSRTATQKCSVKKPK